MPKRYAFLFSFIFLLSLHSAEASSVSGFIPGQIWYSKDTLVAGDTVRVYTAVWNGDSTPLAVHVDFYDNSVILGSRDASMPAVTLEDISIPWKITEGDHLISAKITSSTTVVSGKKESVSIDNKSTSEDHQFIPVVIKKSDGSVATSTDVLKAQVDKLSSVVDSKISSVIPNSVAGSVSHNIVSLEGVRTNLLKTVTNLKVAAEKDVNTVHKSTSRQSSQNTNSTDKPFAYAKLLLISLSYSILDNRIIIYGISIVLLFFILRFIYRKVRYR